jgi:hypothetical protein
MSEFRWDSICIKTLTCLIKQASYQNYTKIAQCQPFNYLILFSDIIDHIIKIFIFINIY